MKATKAKKVGRRAVIKSLTAATSAIAISGAPYIWTTEKPKLRVLGTHVTLQEPIREQAQRDLGIEIEFMPGGSAAVLQKAAYNPQGFDLYEQWSNSIDVLWGARAIQPIETAKIQQWSSINSLSKTGRIQPQANIGLGDAPYKLLNVQPDNSLGSNESGYVSFLPYVHNVDSFGYNSNIVEEGIPYETESWGWLLDEKYHGKVGIVNDPTIGFFDLALSAKAKGLVEINNIGDMTIPEIDNLFKVLVGKKIKGHFGGFWNSVPESIDFMCTGRISIESMFSPAVSDLNSKGIPTVYAAPKEGYRAWHGVMCLSSATQGRVKDMAYEYMNWWLSGWPGAFVARQGYYISNSEKSRPYLSEAEWKYWYEGLPASSDLLGTNGKVAVTSGHVRRGGSYLNRLSNIAVWNSVTTNYDHILAGWYDLLSA